MNYPKLDNVTLIGLGSKARSGKDYAAQHIHQQFPGLTKVYHFADALKAYCRVAHGMTVKDAALLQRIGTDDIRLKDPDMWVRTLYWQIAEERPRFALIPDTRFPNEAEFIKNQGGYLFQVRRVNEQGKLVIANDRDPNHPSETALDGYPGWDKRITAISGDVASLEDHALAAFIDVFQEEML